MHKKKTRLSNFEKHCLSKSHGIVRGKLKGTNFKFQNGKKVRGG